MIPQSIDSFYTTTITTQSIAKNTHAMPYAKKDIDSFYTTTITTQRLILSRDFCCASFCGHGHQVDYRCRHGLSRVSCH